MRRKRPGTLGGGLSVVAVRGAAAPAPQAHLTAPYRPRYSLDQRTAGQYLGGLGTPVAECTYSAAEHPEGIKLRCLPRYKSGPHSLPGAGQGRRTVISV